MDATNTQQLPTIETTLEPSEVVDRLKVRSKRGKLAGFDEHSKSGIAAVAAYGSPFDSILTLHCTDHTVSFQATLAKKIPTIFAIALVLTVWPGLPLTARLNAWRRSIVWRTCRLPGFWRM